MTTFGLQQFSRSFRTGFPVMQCLLNRGASNFLAQNSTKYNNSACSSSFSTSSPVRSDDLKQKLIQVRQQTGAGVMDCKKALESSNMDVNAAIIFLIEKAKQTGLKLGRTQKAGSIGIGFSPDRSKGLLVELTSETDFVARNDKFKSFLQVLSNNSLQAPAIEGAPSQGTKLTGGSIFQPFTVDVEKLTENKDGDATLKQRISELTFAVKENIILRRVAGLSAKSAGGAVGGYIHGEGRIGALVGLKGGSLSSEELGRLADDLAIHVAAANPRYIAKEGEGANASSDDIMTEQQYIMDGEKTVSDVLAKSGAQIQAVVRWERGELLEEAFSK